jgi:sulfatase maturation enzyme AslB (radical SAM superfamily)
MFELNTKHTLQIEITTNCSLACPQCARYVEEDINPMMTRAELDLGDIQRLCPVPWVKTLRKMFMCGNFGEPAAARHCLEVMQWFRSVNPNIVLGINTSGSLRTASWWRDLAAVLSGPLDYAVFSIDGLEDTNSIYRRGSSWSRIMTNAQAFIDTGGSAHWDMLVFEHNQHQIDQAENLARSMGFTWFRTKYTDRPITPRIQWLKKVDAQDPTPVTDKITCHYETTGQAYLAATGQWMPCCYIGGKLEYPDTAGHELRTVFGTPHDQDFDTVHNSPGWQAVWQSWQHQPLRVCRESCTDRNGHPRALDKWQKAVQLK